MGKRKLEMKLIEEKSKRHTTFTKRRQGLIKKAEKFFDDSDTAGAVIVFSQAGNCYHFGHPAVDTVLRRYTEISAGTAEDSTAILSEAQWKICEELEKDGWNETVHKLGLEELVKLLAEMENIDRKFTAAAEAAAPPNKSTEHQSNI